MADHDPREIGRYLARIAAALEIPVATFTPPRATVDDGPDERECAELVLLFKRIGVAEERAAIMAVLRAVTHTDPRP